MKIKITEAIGNHGTFWFFGVICVVGLVFVILCVPETQGKSLEEIERKMMGPVRRLVNRQLRSMNISHLLNFLFPECRRLPILDQ